MRIYLHLIPAMLLGLTCIPLQAQDPEPGDSTPAPARPAMTDATSGKIINLHLKARGGLEALQALNKVEIEGELIEGHQDYQLVIALKAPGNIRIESTRQHRGDDYIIVTASDGTTAWRQETVPERKNPTRVSGMDKQLLELAGMLPFLFIDHQANGHVFAYRGQETYAKRDAYVLHAWLRNGFEMDIFFDAKTFQVINYRHLLSIAGKPILIDRAPSGLVRVSDTWWEKGYVYRLSGKSFRELTYESIKIEAPAANAFTEPPTYERWLKIKR